MKKRHLIYYFLIFSFITVGMASASTTIFFEIDSTLNVDFIDGFDIYLDTDDPDAYDFVIFYKDGKDSNGEQHSYTGAVPQDYVIPDVTTLPGWDIYKFNDGTGVTGSEETLDLQAGVVLSITSESEFSVIEISLSSDEYMDGLYPLSEYDIKVKGNRYIATAVPLPAAVYLFGAGLIGLLGIRRKKA